MNNKLKRLWDEQHGCCYYCSGETFLVGSGEAKSSVKARFGIPEGRGSGTLLRRRRATLEHLRKKADGGTLANTNIVMACMGCNVRRGDLTVEQFKALVSEVVARGIHWTLHPDITNIRTADDASVLRRTRSSEGAERQKRENATSIVQL